MFRHIMSWIGSILNEIYNLITDLLVPALEVVIVIATALSIPKKFLVMMKVAEEFLKKVGSTEQEVKQKYHRR